MSVFLMDRNSLNQHKRYEYCKSRLKYRQSKELTAVKVYTVADESKHLLVFGVPKINLNNEIKRLLQKYGKIEFFAKITDDFFKICTNTEFEIEQFTDIFHVNFEKLEHSRRAKKFMDAKNFYGGILHISYAPELENLDEIRRKLMQRKREVHYRVNINKQMNSPKKS